MTTPAVEVVSREIDELNERTGRIETLLPQLRTTLLSIPSVTRKLSSNTDRRHEHVFDAFSKQQQHSEAVSYRLIAGITAFKVQDPDPYAVDGGNVLGLRFELPKPGAFGMPYFVFLVKVQTIEDTYEEGAVRNIPRLRVHKHTFPAAIDVAQFAANNLPVPQGNGQVEKQDLFAFAWDLRHEVLSWHKRLDAVAQLRLDAGLSPVPGLEEDQWNEAEQGNRATRQSGSIKTITSDAQVHFINIIFTDYTHARIRIARGGSVQDAVISPGSGAVGQHIVDLRREIMGGDHRIEGIIERVQSVLT